MARLSKVAKQAKAVESDPAAELRKKFDRLGYLLDVERRNKPLMNELKALKDEVRGQFASHPAANPVRAEGNVYYIDLTACEERREVTDQKQAFEALQKAAGMEKLLEGLTLPFKLLDAWLDTDQQKAFVKKERTGARDVSAVLKAPQVIAA